MGQFSVLKKPKNEYRPLNYWGWLENIQPDEVEWQIREMYKAGLGGYVMHARGGLEIPYMGSQWMDSVRAMIETGKELGMLSIVDDEDGWPSGFGAGEVNGKGKDYWLKWIEFAQVNARDFTASENTLGVYLIKDNEAKRVNSLSDIIDPNTEVYHFFYKTGRYYVDNLDPRVVSEFIEASYEKYYGRFKSEFGSGIWAIFSDEPQLARSYMAWSGILQDEFAKRCGYDLLDVLPALFFQAGDYRKVRYDYWNTVNRLFEESYGKQIGEWCSRHNVVFTGHTVYEDWFATQILGSGGTMPFYEHMQVPGIDWLCRKPVCNMTVKQVTSVSQQLGKQRVLSEMFGCAGWNVSFEELKWIGEWHYVLGINMMLQHLGLYSLKGARKREYPASLFYQQPWWEEFGCFNDYFARLSEIMAESEPKIDILVLHPYKSGWILFQGSDYEKVGWSDIGIIESALRGERKDIFDGINGLDADFKYLTDSLLELNYDFHYGDEEIMSRHGSVEGGRLKVGRGSYSVVIVPPAITLDKSTLRLLQKFKDEGGRIIPVGRAPECLEGIRSSDCDGLFSGLEIIMNDKKALREALTGILTSPVSVALCSGEENKDIYCCTMKCNGGLLYYMVNTNIDEPHKVNVKISQKGCITRYFADEGTFKPLDSLEGIGIEPAGSMMLIQSEEDICREKPDLLTKQLSSSALSEAEETWDIVDCDLNSLVLDYCSYKIDDGKWQPELPVIMLQQEMLKLGKPADVKMLFRFYSAAEFETPVFLVLEEPYRFAIELNGSGVGSEECGWWVDKSLRKIDISGKIKEGWNEIILTTRFYCSDKVYAILGCNDVHEAESNRLRYDTELESIYILGRFNVEFDGSLEYGERRSVRVNGAFKLSPMASRVKVNNLVAGGFPFYAGKLRLTRKVKLAALQKKQKLMMRFDRPDSIVTKIFVNGSAAKTFAWAPYSVDISNYIVAGENEVELELVNSLRNLMGPHHHKDGELYGVGPYSYKDEKAWTDSYCFVRFGIESGIILDLLSDE